MYYGVFLGLFWILQYSLKIAGEAGLSDRFKYLFYLFNVGTFLLIYLFTLLYKGAEVNKEISFLRCIGFVMAMCFFASFFEGAAIYVHFKFIDPAYFDRMSKIFTNSMNSIPDNGAPISVFIKKMSIQTFSNKLSYVFFDFIGNTFFGAFIGVIMALLVRIRK